jgi:hypothetical protein
MGISHSSSGEDGKQTLLAQLSSGKALSLVKDDKRIISQAAGLDAPIERINNFEQFATALNEVADIAALIESSQAEAFRAINSTFQEDCLQRQARREQDSEPLDYDFATPANALGQAIPVLETEIPRLERRFLPGSIIWNLVFFVIVFVAWVASNNLS